MLRGPVFFRTFFMPDPTTDHPRPDADAPPFLLPVTAALFAERAERFAALAEGHSLGDWLALLARLSRAQQHALGALPELPLPDAAAVAQAAAHGMPPLDPAARPPVWRDALRAIAGELLAAAPPGAQAALQSLLAASDAELERLADALLDGQAAMGDGARLPFIAAALQVVHTQLASRLDAGGLRKLEAANVCPCCGNPAVASIVRLGTVIDKLRYLHCSLCNSEWNVPRAVCTSCGGDKELALQDIDGRPGAVCAETCDACKSYLKIVRQDKDPRVDPVADDLATLSLDLLLDEAGYQRAGPNLLLTGAHGD